MPSTITEQIKTTPGISVIICCYNSSERLPQTLKHLALQQVPEGFPWEIIIVDNASTDNTGSVARAEWDKYKVSDTVSFKIVNEAVPGKINALKTGLNASSYELLIICDDDNWLYNDYLAKSYQLMCSDDTIAAAAGKSEAVADIPIPPWFAQYQVSYAVGKQAEKSGFFDPGTWLWGAGMIFRKSVYLEAYSTIPSFLTGPKEETLSRGEDVEFCHRISLMGLKLYYDENLEFRHFMPTGRLNEQYIKKFLKGYDRERSILNLYKRLIGIKMMPLAQKASLLVQSSVRYLLSATFFKKKWNKLHESETIFLLTGIRVSAVSPEAQALRKFAAIYKQNYS